MLTPLDATLTQNEEWGPRERLSYLPFDFQLSIGDPDHVGTVGLRCPVLQRITGHGSRQRFSPRSILWIAL